MGVDPNDIKIDWSSEGDETLAATNEYMAVATSATPRRLTSSQSDGQNPLIKQYTENG